MRNRAPKYKFKSALLIDDSDLDNFINEKMLQSVHFSEKILVRTNGALALKAITNIIDSNGKEGAIPEVIFVDLNMPVMNGFEFIENFKKLENIKLKHCKLVILTSSIHEDDRTKAAEIDRTIAFINKPLTNNFLNNFPIS